MAIKDDPVRLRVFCDGPFTDLCTPVEFAEIFGVDESAVRHAIRSGRLQTGVDCWKFGKQWVLSRGAFRKFSRGGGYSELSWIHTDYQKLLRQEMGLDGIDGPTNEI